jgi:hypothetical protein
MSTDRRLRRALTLPLFALAALYFLLDGLFGLVVLPVVRRIGRLSPFGRLAAWLRTLPPYAALVILLVPLALVEPPKAWAIYLMATGHLVTGIVIIVTAYVLEIVIPERLFHVCRAQLLSIGWFARAYAVVSWMRDSLFQWLASTAAWRLAGTASSRLASRALALWRRLVSRRGAPLAGRFAAVRRRIGGRLSTRRHLGAR